MTSMYRPINIVGTIQAVMARIEAAITTLLIALLGTAREVITPIKILWLRTLLLMETLPNAIAQPRARVVRHVRRSRVGAANNVIGIGVAVVVLIIVAIVAAYVGGYLVYTLPPDITSYGFVQAITSAISTGGTVFTILFIVLLILAFVILIYVLVGLGGGGGTTAGA